MARKSELLGPGQFLLEGDYMLSSNGIFFALLQGDGNLVVYAGTGPDDVQGGPLWASGYHDKPPGTSFSLDMQADGNLVMYINPSNTPVWATGTAGTNFAQIQQDGEFSIFAGAPGAGGGRVWGTNVRWQRSKVEITDVNYDLARGIVANPQIVGSAEQYYKNGTSVEQHQVFEWEIAYDEARSWSSSLGCSVGIEAEFRGGVPLVGPQGGVTVSATVTLEETVGEESRKSETRRGSFPLAVPPFTTVEAITQVTVADLAVPYAATVKYIFDNGAAIRAHTDGLFAGSSTYRIETETLPVDDTRAQAALAASLRGQAVLTDR